jgi:hypothetical protein
MGASLTSIQHKDANNTMVHRESINKLAKIFKILASFLVCVSELIDCEKKRREICSRGVLV